MRPRPPIVFTLLLLAFIAAGCRKKSPVKPVAPPPVLQQSNPPTTTAPGAGSQTVPESPAAPGNTSPPLQPQPKPKHKRILRHKPKKPSHPATRNAQQTPPQEEVPKITIAEGGAPDAPGNIIDQRHSEDPHEREPTDQLLQTTESNLKSIKRQLTADEQAVVVQIRNFMDQSRAATRDGDAVRAHNLALKAHLLSDSLVAH